MSLTKSCSVLRENHVQQGNSGIRIDPDTVDPICVLDKMVIELCLYHCPYPECILKIRADRSAGREK